MNQSKNLSRLTMEVNSFSLLLFLQVMKIGERTISGVCLLLFSINYHGIPVKFYEDIRWSEQSIERSGFMQFTKAFVWCKHRQPFDSLMPFFVFITATLKVLISPDIKDSDGDKLKLYFRLMSKVCMHKYQAFMKRKIFLWW